MAQKVSLINMKGGVGKSTLAVNLAWHFSAYKKWSKRVLVVDLERQKAIDFARASVSLEGFFLSPEVEAINQLYIDGELSGDQHIASIRAVIDLKD